MNHILIYLLSFHLVVPVVVARIKILRLVVFAGFFAKQPLDILREKALLSLLYLQYLHPSPCLLVTPPPWITTPAAKSAGLTAGLHPTRSPQETSALRGSTTTRPTTSPIESIRANHGLSHSMACLVNTSPIYHQ